MGTTSDCDCQFCKPPPHTKGQAMTTPDPEQIAAGKKVRDEIATALMKDRLAEIRARNIVKDQPND